MKRIKIFDTTLRDGEQSPGCSMNINEKLEMAKQLDKLGVDIIEAGFAAASPGDMQAVKAIAEIVESAEVASLARCKKSDIDMAYAAVSQAKKARIHVFIATSDVHMKYKLKMSKDQVLDTAYNCVKYAASLCKNVEFSAEDATRSDREFLKEVYERVIEAGATTLNMPDTVGYSNPEEIYDLVRYLKSSVKGIDTVNLAVHCHDDLGLAVANSLSAVKAGADQIECTINGIGERAGNAALEEIVMNLKTRSDCYMADTAIDSKQLYKTSRLLSKITGIKVQPNKAIIGDNAFAHESGIHQHGVLANKSTYEIMKSEDIGIMKNTMILGKHSGKHALRDRYQELGFTIADDELDKLFEKFKALADTKKEVSDLDLEHLVRDKRIKVPEEYTLLYFVNTVSNQISSTSNIKIKRADGKILETVVMSKSGSIDAAYKAISQVIKKEFKLVDFSINTVSEGADAQAYVTVKIEENGKVYNGHAVAQDIVEAAIQAYLSAINSLIYDQKIIKGDSNVK